MLSLVQKVTGKQLIFTKPVFNNCRNFEQYGGYSENRTSPQLHNWLQEILTIQANGFCLSHIYLDIVYKQNHAHMDDFRDKRNIPS